MHSPNMCTEYTDDLAHATSGTSSGADYVINIAMPVPKFIWNLYQMINI